MANKGEWSEPYTLVKLLAEGKIHAADANLNKIPEIYYPLIKILRTELTNNYEYVYGDVTMNLVDGETGNLILAVPLEDFTNNAIELLRDIRSGTGNSFEVSQGVEEFLKEILVIRTSQSSQIKRDITIVVHDVITGFKPTLGFSIKSQLGKPATLLNASGATNFIYKLVGDSTLSDADIEIINGRYINPAGQIKYSGPKNVIEQVVARGFDFEFVGLQNSNFDLNLQIIDSKLPDILSHMLVYYYTNASNASVESLLEHLLENNPCEFNLERSHPFYKHKIKSFLIDVALGMRPTDVWNGIYDANGGYIVVKDDGELVCYHVYNRDEFQEYLVKNTKFETPSKRESMGRFCLVYKENGELYIKLILQIRFR